LIGGGGGVRAGQSLGVTLAVLPLGPPVCKLDKDTKKEILQLFSETCKAMADKTVIEPVEILELWARVREWLKLGISQDEILGKLAVLMKAQKVKLCADPLPVTLDAWRQRLSQHLGSQLKWTEVESSLANLRRADGETAVAFLQRVTPQVSTAVELGIAKEAKEVARLWSETTLGATYHRKNRVDFQWIEGHIANGSIATVAALTEAAIAVQRNEHVPSKGVGSVSATVAAGKTAAPVVKEA